MRTNMGESIQKLGKRFRKPCKTLLSILVIPHQEALRTFFEPNALFHPW